MCRPRAKGQRQDADSGAHGTEAFEMLIKGGLDGTDFVSTDATLVQLVRQPGVSPDWPSLLDPGISDVQDQGSPWYMPADRHTALAGDCVSSSVLDDPSFRMPDAPFEEWLQLQHRPGQIIGMPAELGSSPQPASHSPCGPIDMAYVLGDIPSIESGHTIGHAHGLEDRTMMKAPCHVLTNFPVDSLDPHSSDLALCYGMLNNDLAVPQPNGSPTLITPVGTSRVVKRKRQRYDSESRKKVKLVRRQGACVRCRIYKMSCDLDDECANCRKVCETATVFKLSCERMSLKDVLPFRVGNSRTGMVTSVLPTFNWSMDDRCSHKIKMSPIYCGGVHTARPTLEVVCRRFTPKPGVDVLTETYELCGGGAIVVDFPAYACYGAESRRMRDAISNYLDACRPFAEHAIDSVTTDSIIRIGLAEARRYSATRDTAVTNALKIQAAAFTSEVQPENVGEETLGVPLIDNTESGYRNKRLIPISLDYQMDVLYIQYMTTNLQPIVARLNKLVFPKASQTPQDKRRSWYEILLTMFVLLCTLEQVFGSQVAFVRKYSGTDDNVFAAATYVKRIMLEQWQTSAKNLIYHFQCVIRGSVPFSHTQLKEMEDQACLDKESLNFLKSLRHIVDERKEELQKLRNADLSNERAVPLTWISQLLLDTA